MPFDRAALLRGREKLVLPIGNGVLYIPIHICCASLRLLVAYS
uniref:Uncharacterized protein n=1 Tax=Arundo donax TaxID=35708 RepID=A0A0A8XW47_ARUDO